MSSFTDQNDHVGGNWQQALDWEPCRLMFMAIFLDRGLIPHVNRDFPVDIIVENMGYEHFRAEYWGRI